MSLDRNPKGKQSILAMPIGPAAADGRHGLCRPFRVRYGDAAPGYFDGYRHPGDSGSVKGAIRDDLL